MQTKILINVQNIHKDIQFAISNTGNITENSLNSHFKKTKDWDILLLSVILPDDNIFISVNASVDVYFN